jgi:eukaryotic-like serine/threonine-protein kinase
VRDIDVGQIIAGKYELVRLLGQGAMGTVWLARHDTLGGEFAIKLVDTEGEIAEEEGAAGRFQLEAQLSAKLSRRTRHIVSVSDHGEEDGLAYLVMELLEGESLEARIKRGEPLSVGLTAAILIQIARALSIAHAEGVFHRDLKPGNIFLSNDEDGRLLVKLLDFGIARSVKPVTTRSAFATGKDMVLGTPSYMSPEQARGLPGLDHRCDVWALAAVAYEALTGNIPWNGETVEDIFLSICTHRVVPIRERRADLPEAIDSFYVRAFSTKIEDRFQTAEELVAEFAGLADPAELEASLGPAVLVPISDPRLPVATAGAAEPQTTAAKEAAGPPQPSRRDAPLGSDPDMAISEPTGRNRRRKGGAGWLFAAAGGIVTIGLVLAAFVFQKNDASGSTQPPLEPTTFASQPAAHGPKPVAPNLALPSESPAEAAEAKADTAPPPEAKAASPSRGSTPRTRPRSSAKAAEPAAPIAAPKPAPAAPTSKPTATARPPLDKGEVF